MTNISDRISARIQSRTAGQDSEAGMSSAEYAVGSVAAAGLAGVLYKILTSDTAKELIMVLIKKAFKLW